jgi:hypothetical protein
VNVVRKSSIPGGDVKIDPRLRHKADIGDRDLTAP